MGETLIILSSGTLSIQLIEIQYPQQSSKYDIKLDKYKE